MMSEHWKKYCPHFIGDHNIPKWCKNIHQNDKTLSGVVRATICLKGNYGNNGPRCNKCDFYNVTSSPDIQRIEEKVSLWASKNPRVVKVYLFGSYIKKNKPTINDIDIAIEISHKEADTAFGFWCSQASKMEQDLTFLLNYKAHLWRFAEDTPTIKKGLDEGSVLIYEKKDIFDQKEINK